MSFRKSNSIGNPAVLLMIERTLGMLYEHAYTTNLPTILLPQVPSVPKVIRRSHGSIWSCF